jgi:hypothetical protein
LSSILFLLAERRIAGSIGVFDAALNAVAGSVCPATTPWTAHDGF